MVAAAPYPEIKPTSRSFNRAGSPATIQYNSIAGASDYCTRRHRRLCLASNVDAAGSASILEGSGATTTRLVDTATIPMLFKTVGAHKIDSKLLITHHFELDKILDAYETFDNAAKTKALKVIIEA